MEETLKKFDKLFPHKIAEVIDDFGSTTKDEIKQFITQALQDQLKDLEEKVVGEEMILNSEKGFNSDFHYREDGIKIGKNQKRQEIKQIFKEYK